MKQLFPLPGMIATTAALRVHVGALYMVLSLGRMLSVPPAFFPFAPGAGAAPFSGIVYIITHSKA